MLFALVVVINAEIAEIETEIKKIMDSIASPTLSVLGISYALGAVIVSEVGDFSRFDNPDKLLAFAGCSPSTYQSGQIYSTHAKMGKRGSRYLRWALLNAAKYVCKWEPSFAAYLRKKLAEASITMPPCLMPQRSLFACFITLKLRAKNIFHKLSLEPELTNTYCISRRSVPLTNRRIQMLQFFCKGVSRLCCLALSVALADFFSASVCCLSRAAHFFAQSSFGGLTFNR